MNLEVAFMLDQLLYHRFCMSRKEGLVKEYGFTWLMASICFSSVWSLGKFVIFTCMVIFATTGPGEFELRL